MSDKHKITWLDEYSVMTEDYPKPDPLFSNVYSMDVSTISGQTIVGKKMIQVEKEVYEAVLRNSLRVNELEQALKLTKANGKYPDKISKLKSRIASLCEENKQLIELLKECKEAIEKAQKNYGYDDSIIEILEPVTIKIEEVL